MTSDKPLAGKPEKGSETKPRGGSVKQPEWAQGLQKLYDSVVEEELPDSFKDLLSQLDSKG